MSFADVSALKQHLDELVGQASFWPEPTERFVEAQRDFIAAGPDLCAPLGALLWEHYESLAPMWAMEQNAAARELERIPTLTDASQVWAYIEVPYPPEIGGLDEPDEPVAIPLQVNVAWYPGHGLTAVFQGDSVTLEQ